MLPWLPTIFFGWELLSHKETKFVVISNFSLSLMLLPVSRLIYFIIPSDSWHLSALNSLYSSIFTALFLYSHNLLTYWTPDANIEVPQFNLLKEFYLIKYFFFFFLILKILIYLYFNLWLKSYSLKNYMLDFS